MPDAPDPEDREAAARLRQALENAGYREDEIREVLGIDPVAPTTTHDVEVYMRRLAAPHPLHTLLKLFALGAPVTEEEARSALEPLELERAERNGLIELKSGRVIRGLALTMADGMWLVHDPYVPEPGSPRPDHVLSAGPASHTLASLTVRVPDASVLDLGTGCGIQALVASRHSKRVVATDTNVRALRVAAFNASLNGIENVEFREGSFFEPVAGERFDLVASNPPFILSPETRFQFRDSGLPGDDVSREVVRGAAEHLTDGGFATILCNWAVSEKEEWSDPPSRWVEGIGADAWILHSATQDPISYAATWITGEGKGDYGATLDRWLGYYEEIGAAAICTGAVILRRRDAGGVWVRADQLPGPVDEGATPHILRVFANQDYLGSIGRDDELLDGTFRLTPEHRVEQTLAYVEGSYEMEGIRLRLERGLPFSGSVDVHVLRVLSGCDGRRRLREVVGEAAAAMGVEAGQLEPLAVGMVRQMLSLGFLEAPGAGSPTESPPGS
jgi:methylase of polypeptide subunit release factors